MSQLIKYQGLTLDVMDAADQQADAIAGGDFWDIEVGENVFRVLPVPIGEKAVRVTAMHYVDAVPGLDKMIVFACPRTETKASCPACEETDRLQKTGNPTDRERAFRIQSKLKVYLNAVNRNKPDAGVKVLSFGKQIWEQLKTIRKNARAGGDYTDPTANGFDIIITRVGTGRETEYTVAADRSNSPLAADDDAISDIIMQTKNLEKYVDTTINEALLNAWSMNNARTPYRAPAPAAGQLVQGAREAAAQHVGTVGANVMSRQRAAPAPAAAPTQSAIIDAEFDDEFAAPAQPAQPVPADFDFDAV